MNRHHKLLEEIGHLKDREHALLSGNDQLRAQLVEMKEQENKKYDDLMVQYNMKREYEVDGLDNEDTSNNQVTVKTEWDDEEVKVQIKEEIKEEDEEDRDDDCGCDRFVVKKEEVSDDDNNSMQTNLNQPMDTSSRDQLHTPTDSVCAPSPNEPMQVTNSSVTEQANMDQVMSHENGSGDEDDEELSNSAHDNHDGAVVASNEPSTSARPLSNRVTSKQSTASTARKLNKRKQSQPNRTGKRSKKTVEVNEGEDEEDGDDIANEDRDEAKVKVIHLNCTESNCNVKLDSMDHLHVHLSTVHKLFPLQCFATNCHSRFDNKGLLGDHIKLSHSQSTRFLCSVCHKEYDSQHNAYLHWYQSHLTGQFQCNFASDCTKVTDTRGKMTSHQLTAHRSQLKHLHCTQPGCTASFAFKADMKRHQLTHLATNQFHCNWPHCSKQCKKRSDMVRHIRMCHFGLPKSMKAQKEKNIVDLRDPNEYVRVVGDE